MGFYFLEIRQTLPSKVPKLNNNCNSETSMKQVVREAELDLIFNLQDRGGITYRNVSGTAISYVYILQKINS
jgi:hypothetical protein